MKKYLTLLKRECWENRFSFFIAPIILASLVMLLAVFMNVNDYGNGQIGFKMSVKDSTWLLIREHDLLIQIGDLTEGSEGEVRDSEVVLHNELSYASPINSALLYSASLFAYLMVIVFVSYALTCLQDEQKNNSMLFWNSFPVSHTETVLVKLFTASVLLPAIALVAIIATHVFIIVIVWLRLMGTEEFGQHIWPNLHLLEFWLSYAVNILVFVLGSFSAVGLLLTISATAYRASILLALALLSLAVISFFITGDGMTVIRFMFIETLFTSTSLFGSSPSTVLNGDTSTSLFLSLAGPAIETLQSYSFWLAAVIGGAMVIPAIIIRKYRSEV